MMKEYIVKWSMPTDADSPEEALKIHRDPGNIATVFEIDGKQYEAREFLQ